jgi:cob(I)alamin adenosyltransferase
MPRLSKIYTRTGDDGTTGLATGERIGKQSTRIQAMGDVDELNSLIGVLNAQDPIPQTISPILLSIQHRLFDIGGELAMPDSLIAQDAWVESLEQWLDQINADLPPLKEFILPGGNLAAAHCHHARSVCRRAERTCWQLSGQEKLNPVILRYLNRLSDLLFVLARHLARQNGCDEITWQKGF